MGKYGWESVVASPPPRLASERDKRVGENRALNYLFVFVSLFRRVAAGQQGVRAVRAAGEPAEAHGVNGGDRLRGRHSSSEASIPILWPLKWQLIVNNCTSRSNEKEFIIEEVGRLLQKSFRITYNTYLLKIMREYRVLLCPRITHDFVDQNRESFCLASFYFISDFVAIHPCAFAAGDVTRAHGTSAISR